MWIATLGLALVLLAGPALPDKGSTSAHTQALCRSVAHLSPPASDYPDAQTVRRLKSCSSETLYYGVGRPKDYVAARQCALLERADRRSADTERLHGAEMLMAIYANGYGARRDLGLAMAMACELAPETPPVDVDTLVEDLDQRRRTPDPEPFDYCRDVNPGYSNVSVAKCTAFEARLKAPARAQALARLTDGLSPAAKAALQRLDERLEAYAAARADGERGGFVMARHLPVAFREGLLDARLDLITRLAAGRGPVASSEQRAAEDARLNQTYRAVLKQLVAQNPVPGVDVTPDGVRAAERAWLLYRDAWLELVRVSWPHASVDGVAHLLTEQRSAALRCVAPQNDEDNQRCDG